MSDHSVDDGAGRDVEADWFRPVWADSEAEIADAAPPWAPPAAARQPPAAPSARWDRDPRALASLLGPALAATDAFARLDARAGAASEPVREGLIRRLALHEAAGWLAAQAAWVHPIDLALRSGHVAGPFGLAAVAGRVGAELPNTAAAGAGEAWQALEGWGGVDAEEPFAAASADDAVNRAVHLARALERLALLRTRNPLRSELALAAALASLGAGEPDPTRTAAWRRDALAGVGACRPGRDSPLVLLPPLLAAALAAQAWAEAGGDAAQSLFGAAALLARVNLLRAVPLPFWAAYPALGQSGGPGRGLPGARADAPAQDAGASAAWPAAFCRLAREAALAGLRELDRLERAAERGRAATAGLDRRSRMPDALHAALRTPALTSTVLASKLDVAPQTATALLRDLLAAGVVREVTGRKHFRAWAA